MFGPRLREEEILWIVVDARVGGAFSFLVRRGEMAIDYVGTYQHLERPKRWAEYTARTEAGWTRMLEALTELLA